MAAHEKSPSVAAHGAEEIQTREMLCAATLPAPPVGSQCSSCGHFRTPSAGCHPHSFCRFTGEKVRPDDPARLACPGHGQGGAA
jgi:hypothetical protein